MSLVRVFEAVRSEDLLKFLKDFIENDSHNINESDEDGTTCLHIAAGLHDKTILEYLLKHGAYIDSTNSDGLTPLHIAAIWGRSGNVSILLNYGANIHQKDNNGYTAKIHASVSKENGSSLCEDSLASYLASTSLSNTKISPDSSGDNDSEAFVTAYSSPELNETPTIEFDFERLNGSPWITPGRRRQRQKDKARNKSNCNKEILKLCFTEEKAVGATGCDCNSSGDENLETCQNKDNDCSPHHGFYEEYLTEMSLDLLSNSGNSTSQSDSTTFSYSTITHLESQTRDLSQDNIFGPPCNSALLIDCSKRAKEEKKGERQNEEKEKGNSNDNDDDGGDDGACSGGGDDGGNDGGGDDGGAGSGGDDDGGNDGGDDGSGGDGGDNDGSGGDESGDDDGSGDDGGNGGGDDYAPHIQVSHLEEIDNHDTHVIGEKEKMRKETDKFGDNNTKSIRNATFVISMTNDNLAQNPTNFFVPFQNNVRPTNSIPATKTHPFIPPCSKPPPKETDETVIYDWKAVSMISDEKDESPISIPKSYNFLTTDEIRKKMISLGETPGPITSHTKQLYLRKLWKLENGLGGKNTKKDSESALNRYPPELRMILTGRSTIPNFSCLEEEMMNEFSVKKAQWRGGNEKSSFNYLLLDPRVSCNLPSRSRHLSKTEAFRCFILSIFYVGKGKRSRPYAHLHEAIKNGKKNKKLSQIWDIWDAGLGVISVHIFQSAIPVEAFTREAHMVEALGLSQLTNQKRGEYYGLCSSLPLRKKRNLGIFFLNKALQIFLQEGEREICKDDL